MKKYLSYFWFFILAIYCVILISIEIGVSQEYVRNFFTDIKGDVASYAINTSLSVFLLLGTSLIFSIALLSLPVEESNSSKIIFYRSQVILFIYLGLDDRFLIHEYIGHIFKINDALILAGLGLVEIILILGSSNYQQWSRKTRNYLLAGAACFALMIVIDGAFPSEMIPRLSLEDLSKTWANTFIFMFAWNLLAHNIDTLKARNQNSSYHNFTRNEIEKVNCN